MAVKEVFYDSVGHLVEEAEYFANDVKRADDLVFAQAVELFVRILSDKVNYSAIG